LRVYLGVERVFGTDSAVIATIRASHAAVARRARRSGKLRFAALAAAFELLVPGSSCEKESGATPATLSVAIAELELPKDHRSARLTINSEAQCLQRGCGFSGLCLATVTEEQFDAGDNCAVVTVNTRAPQDDSGLTTHMTIQVDTDERKLVELVVVGPPDDDGRSLHCRGWSDL
jgi:hypothetical protein